MEIGGWGDRGGHTHSHLWGEAGAPGGDGHIESGLCVGCDLLQLLWARLEGLDCYWRQAKG